MRDAPKTEARQFMIRMAQPEFITNLTDMIADRVHFLVSEELLSVQKLKSEMYDRGQDTPADKAMAAMLSKAKFEALGRHTIGEGERHYLYSKLPELYQSDENAAGRDSDDGPAISIVIDPGKIKKYIRLKLAEQEDEL